MRHLHSQQLSVKTVVFMVRDLCPEMLLARTRYETAGANMSIPPREQRVAHDCTASNCFIMHTALKFMDVLFLLPTHFKIFLRFIAKERRALL
jgi:hypothetical protein